MTNAVNQQQDRLYEQVANRVADMIDKGALKPGERIPSIRRMSDQMSVAISTVLHAYQILEDRGLIEARTRSGYFIRPKHSKRVADSLAPMEPVSFAKGSDRLFNFRRGLGCPTYFWCQAP